MLHAKPLSETGATLAYCDCDGENLTHIWNRHRCNPSHTRARATCARIHTHAHPYTHTHTHTHRQTHTHERTLARLCALNTPAPHEPAPANADMHMECASKYAFKSWLSARLKCTHTHTRACIHVIDTKLVAPCGHAHTCIHSSPRMHGCCLSTSCWSCKYHARIFGPFRWLSHTSPRRTHAPRVRVHARSVSTEYP